MISLNDAATEVFQILRSYDYTVMMYDDDGKQVYEPDTARRFFAKPENILVALVDDGDNSSIRLYLGNTEISDVMGLDQTLRTTATKFNMIFNLKRAGRDLSPTDFASHASVTEARREDKMNVLEGMYGTTRSSYIKLENARMIVRHSKKIDEMVMGSRGRHIEAIFVENAVGERFLFPTRQLAPARAMTQHVNQGGSFADIVGQQIGRMATDFANLGAASGHIATNSTVLGESALSIRETCRNRMYEMRKCFEAMYRAKTPEKWESLSEALQAWSPNALNEGNEDTVVDITEVKSLLTVEGKELDESVLTTVAQALAEREEVSVEEGATTEIKEPSCPTCNGRGQIGDRNCQACDGSGVESKSVVGRKISARAWTDFTQGKLELFHKPEEDGESPKFTNRDAELAYRLSQIVPEVKNDSMMNLLSFVSEALGEQNDPARQGSLRKIAIHALTLAGLRVNEGISPNNEVVKEYSDWLNGFKTANVLAEREEDEDHDDRSDAERYHGDGDPTSYASGSEEDAIQRAEEEVSNSFDPEEFLRERGDEFMWGDSELSDEDKTWEKSYILGALASYLTKKVEAESGFTDVDMIQSAKDLFDQVEAKLTEAGYILSEGDLSREDMVIQSDPSIDLQREVTKPSADDDYVARMRTLAGMPYTTPQ